MKTLTKAMAMSVLMLGGLATPVHADIDDWLRRTFSSTDHVGNWLRDTFGPVQNPGGTSTGHVDVALPDFRRAQMAVAKWDKSEQRYAVQKRYAKKSTQAMRQVCSDDVLVSVVAETQDLGMTQRICFKPAAGKVMRMDNRALKAAPMQRR